LPDPEQAGILASYNMQRFRRLKEEQREVFNDANLVHALEISRQRAATEEVGRLLMEAKRQKLYELNARRHYEEFAREQARRSAATPAVMLHRQMREARDEKRARTQAAKAKNDDEAGSSSAPNQRRVDHD
jgi:hypothetical protein